ncbi:uncharacterized protein LOC111395417 [Olea europaea var. sylvestris]|uniref:uncharacterized protein LOC111395417 n=1 Tax=Olea europaea var. sylvestris TaxID=158386 RepID=UPI000C1CE05A|nr:uncharacterized protein LOC111395417 [Olea europaea var. sylvestris]
MEDSFKVRVDKAFGSLGNTAPSLSVNPSLWRLTDDEIKRQEWNRNKEEEEDDDEDEVEESGPTDYPPNNPETDVGAHLESDLQELSDFEGEDEINGEIKRHGTDTGDDEVWDVQSLIGRDCTLDYEEEEDEYDKVAVCREEVGDRLYMRDVKVAEYGFERLNTYGELPDTFQDAVRDPRANHMAAKLRLKEDAEAAGNNDSLPVADNSVALDVETENLNHAELDGYNPKSILKKRGSHMDQKPEKRVRFQLNHECSTQNLDEQGDLVSEPYSGDNVAAPQDASDLSQYSSAVPDYLRNPSKYTRYTFDSSEDMDEQSNRKAYMDFFHQLRKGNTESSLQDDTCADILKSIVFTPKKKPEDDLMVKRRNESLGDNAKKKGLLIGVAEEDAQESEVSEMEEDEPYIDKGSSSLQKPGRQYRSRISADADDNLT